MVFEYILHIYDYNVKFAFDALKAEEVILRDRKDSVDVFCVLEKSPVSFQSVDLKYSGEAH